MFPTWWITFTFHFYFSLSHLVDHCRSKSTNYCLLHLDDDNDVDDDDGDDDVNDDDDDVDYDDVYNDDADYDDDEEDEEDDEEDDDDEDANHFADPGKERRCHG